MFSSFGSPLYENFQDKPPSPKLNCNMLKKRKATITNNLQTVNKNLKKHNCGMNDNTTASTIEPFYAENNNDICEVDCHKKFKSDKKLSKCYQDRVEAECDEDNEGNGNNEDNEDSGNNEDNEGSGNNEDNEGGEDKVDDEEDGSGDEDEDDNEGEEDGSDDKDDEDENGVNKEKFLGNSDTIEGFVGNSDKINLHFVLKCILFACLFFILAHDDTRNYLVSMVKIKKGQYIYLGSVLFFVIYLILNMIL